jgi:hypothetical protein
VRVSLHLRPNQSLTNERVLALGRGLELAGCTLVQRGRNDPMASGTDIVLQSGIGGSHALRQAIDDGIPYLIAESPAYRHISDVTQEAWVSYGYGGLMGGAFHTPAPKAERWKPTLKPMKTEGATIIFAQKSNDHSLRTQVHDEWLQVKLIQFPNAEFRAHPLMTPKYRTQEPIREALLRCGTAITYTSTAGTEALIEGCVSKPEHWGSSAYGVKDREAWLHELSWQNFPFATAATCAVGKHILAGFEIAKVRAESGQQEVPRDKAKLQIWQYNIDDPRVEETR